MSAISSMDTALDSTTSTASLETPTAVASVETTKRTRTESIHSIFSAFGTELDAHYDRRERINKLSKDITALSKKLIFALHRITSKDRKSVLKEADGKLEELRSLFERLGPEVQGENFWRYERQVSGGVQEYLEGLTFYHYLFNHSIPSVTLCQSALSSPPPAPSASADPSSTPDSIPAPTHYVQITSEDYLGGIADLTGELMRLAIGSVGSNLVLPLADWKEGEKEKELGVASIDSIGRTVREIKGEMDPLAQFCRWLPKKLVVLDQSLEKIEKASYGLTIRRDECRGSSVMLEMLRGRIAAGGGGGNGAEE